MRFYAVCPCGTCNIEMGPFCFVDKLLDEYRSHDSAGFAAGADILDIGYIGFDLFAIFSAQRQLPISFTYRLATLDDLIYQALIVTHNTRILITQGDDNGTSEGRHIHDASRTLFFRKGYSISEHQPPFGVRV